MGYREDGTFGFKDAGASSGGKTNPAFTYPSRSIRFLEGQAALDGKPDSYKIHRGYIRNLEQPALPGIPISKCYFQFNPQEIKQGVAMREDMYLAILQDPAQLTQPVGSVMNFQFDLLFDRSLEVATGVKGTYTTKVDGDARQVPRNVTSNIDSPNPDEDVYDIGVMADLRVLYAVIGQGFSKEMLTWQLSSLKNAAERVFNSTSAGASPDGTTTEFTVDDSKAASILTNNFGNAAFIMPNPVRVMFSSLFMLDGFVTGTQVDFLKFNTNMVPLVCRVAISMSAMYIGFAKQDTFVTTQLEAAGGAKLAQDQQAAVDRAELLAALNKTGRVFGVAYTSELTQYDSDFSHWDAILNNEEDTVFNKAWMYLVQDSGADQSSSATHAYRALYCGFPQIVPIEGGEDIYSDDGTVRREGADKDEILALMQKDSNISVSYTTSLSMYGKKPGVGETGLTESQAQSAITNNSYATSTTLLGSYSNTETASTDAEWGKGKSGDGVKSERVRRRAIHAQKSNPKISNTSTDAWQLSPTESAPPARILDAYYIVVISLTVTATTSSNEQLVSTAEKKLVVKGDARIPAQKFVLNWGTNGQFITPLIGAR